jgi:hypothetical protein
VPLNSANRYFELYHVRELPITTVVALTHALCSYVIVTQFPYFAITVDRESYILLDHTDVIKCSGEAQALCPVAFVVVSASQQHCLADLFLGRNDDVTELRDRRVVGAQRLPVWNKPPDKNSWIFSVSERRRDAGEVTCECRPLR